MGNPNGHLIHGHKRVGCATTEYKTWLRMKARCYRKSDKDFANWGAKGIGVCERWRNDFQAFFEDMGPKPSPGHSIDRLDPTKDYGPGNCRWATLQQQGSENRSGLIRIEVNGLKFRSKAEACRHFGIGQTTLQERLRAGIPLESAFQQERLKSRRTKESYWRKDLR